MKARDISLKSGIVKTLTYTREDANNKNFSMKKVVWDMFYADDKIETVVYIMKVIPQTKKNYFDLIKEFVLEYGKNDAIYMIIPDLMTNTVSISISDAKVLKQYSVGIIRKVGFVQLFWGKFLRPNNDSFILNNPYASEFFKRWESDGFIKHVSMSEDIDSDIADYFQKLSSNGQSNNNNEEEKIE